MSVAGNPTSSDHSGGPTGGNTVNVPGANHAGGDRWFVATCIVVGLLAIIAFRAAFSAYFLLDDFGMLAIARFVSNPFGSFVHDQFPGGLYYRPVGMLVWWFSERTFGAIPFGHYCLNLVLHCSVAVALGSLIQRFFGNRWLSLFVAACFVLHPIGIGTTLWLSDRFDLLALLFGLLGLHAALRFSRIGSTRSLWVALAFFSLSLLSKEIALACFAGAGILLLGATNGDSPARRVRNCLYLVALAAIYLIARTLILESINAQSLYSTAPLRTLLVDGIAHWLTGWRDYFFFWPRLDGWKKLLSISSTVLIAALVIASMRRSWTASRRQALLVGVAILLSSSLLQWPLLSHFSVALNKSGSVVETVVNTRYFYTSLAGFLIALAALVSPMAASKLGRQWLGVAALGLLIPWFAGSQALARAHSKETQRIEAIVKAANAAIGTLDLPEKGCQIYLLDTTEWSLGWISDEAIKATFPNLERIAGCLIQTEHTPWYHIAVMKSVDVEDLQPMTLVKGAVRETAIRPVGRAKFLKLSLDMHSEVPKGSKARFLSWQGSDFIDVTGDVLSGRRKPAFACNLPEINCSH